MYFANFIFFLFFTNQSFDRLFLSHYYVLYFETSWCFLDGIFFLIERPTKLNYIYQINPSYHIGAKFPDYVIEVVRHTFFKLLFYELFLNNLGYWSRLCRAIGRLYRVGERRFCERRSSVNGKGVIP